MRDPILFHPDPNTPWIIETNSSKTAFAGVLLQSHVYNSINRKFQSYLFPTTLQGCSKHLVLLSTNFMHFRLQKLSYMIKGCKVTIRTDHKPPLEIVSGTVTAQDTAAADKFHYWTADILARDPHPTIEYKKGSLNLVANSVSRLRTGEHCEHN